MYAAGRTLGEHVSRVSEISRTTLEPDRFRFNIHLLMGGQIKGQTPDLYLIYPQGNPLKATEENPFLQIGETKYGRPILDRGIRFGETKLEEAAKYALISLDSTMRSNVTVGPPIDILLYPADSLAIQCHRRFSDRDPDLTQIRLEWEEALRKAVSDLPPVELGKRDGADTTCK